MMTEAKSPNTQRSEVVYSILKSGHALSAGFSRAMNQYVSENQMLDAEAYRVATEVFIANALAAYRKAYPELNELVDRLYEISQHLAVTLLGNVLIEDISTDGLILASENLEPVSEQLLFQENDYPSFGKFVAQNAEVGWLGEV